MTDPAIQELTAALAALRAELDDVKSQLKDICRAVQIDADNGKRRISLVCHHLIVRTGGEKRTAAIRISTSDGGGQISFYHPDGSNGDIALSLGIDKEGQPALRLIGEDNKDRVLLGVEKDHGMAAFFSPGSKPGAVIRAIPGGGSFAVLQPDGKARGIFMHSDGSAKPGGKPKTEILFATPDAKTMLHLHAGDDGSMVCLSQPGAPNCATLVASHGSASLLVQGAGDTTSALIIASPDLARISTFSGESTRHCAAALCSEPGNGSNLTLRRLDGTIAIEAVATTPLSTIRLVDTAGKEAIELDHCPGSLNNIRVNHPAGTEAISVSADAGNARLALYCSQRRELHTWLAATDTDLRFIMFDDKRPLVAIGHAEQGGQIAAYGPGENSGMAALSGQQNGASVLVASADSTTLAALGATDHGGHLSLNNDLGFPRISMGIYHESSAIALNHTGQQGVSITASPLGGVLQVHDKDGRVVEALTGFDHGPADDD